MTKSVAGRVHRHIKSAFLSILRLGEKNKVSIFFLVGQPSSAVPHSESGNRQLGLIKTMAAARMLLPCVVGIAALMAFLAR